MVVNLLKASDWLLATGVLTNKCDDVVLCRLQSHFESIQRISDSTTLPSVLPHLKARLFAQVDLSGLTDRLMLGKEDPQALSSREKMQLWQELKTLSKIHTYVCQTYASFLFVFRGQNFRCCSLKGKRPLYQGDLSAPDRSLSDIAHRFLMWTSSYRLHVLAKRNSMLVFSL